MRTLPRTILEQRYGTILRACTRSNQERTLDNRHMSQHVNSYQDLGNGRQMLTQPCNPMLKACIPRYGVRVAYGSRQSLSQDARRTLGRQSTVDRLRL